MPASSERASHWDWMLEHQSVLRTWCTNEFNTTDLRTSAEALPDHRVHYLDYEGEVSGNRGRVYREDFGSYQWLTDRNDQLIVLLRGERLLGQLTLQRERAGDWSLSFSQSKNESLRRVVPET